MKKNQGILYRFGFYPLLLGLYPVLFLWLANYYRVHAYVVPNTLLISELFAAVVYLLAWLVIRRSPQGIHAGKAAALAGITLVLFFFYGHVYTLLDNTSVFGVDLGRHMLLLPLWLVLFATSTFWIIRSRSDFRSFTWGANLVGIFLVAVNLLQIGYVVVQPPRLAAAQNPDQVPVATSSPGASGPDRDIYFILLDSYSRQDTLDKYGLDNSGFIKELTDLGFVVPDCNLSNYVGTPYSMSSIFNMNYLDELGYPYAQLANGDAGNTMVPLLQNNPVIKKMKQAGYQIVTFASIYYAIDYRDKSDIYYNYEDFFKTTDKQETRLFQTLFIRTTLLKPVDDYLTNNPDLFQKVLSVKLLHFLDPGNRQFESDNRRQYEQNLYALEKLEQVPQLPGKKFVYAHLYVTHQPFTFNPDGSFRKVFKDSVEAYRDQIIYANLRIIPIVKKILSESAVPPVIVIMGDHGFSTVPEDKLKNFSAYYLPDGGNEKVYPQMTALNTFRLIFSYYFNEDYPLLKDASFVISKDLPGGYKLVPGSCVHEGQNP